MRATMLFMCAALAFLAACDEAGEKTTEAPPPVRPVKTVTVEARSDRLEFSYPATVAAPDEAELSFRVSGNLVDLPITEGAAVARGDVIARLDTRDFEAEIARLESQLAQAQAQLSGMTAGARTEDVAALQANVEAALAQFRSAQEQARRTVQLFKRGVAAKAALDRDIAALRVADADVKAKRQELAKGQAGARGEDIQGQQAVIAGIRSQIESARNQLADATLRAPFDGTIAARMVENFTNVQAKEPIAVLQSLGGLELVFDVPGPDVAKVGSVPDSERRSHAVLDAAPGREFATELVEFSTQPDAATQTYRGRVAIERPDDVAILPGMTGRVFVSIPSGGDGIALPAAALGTDPDGSFFVWVVSGEEKRIEKRPVEAGAPSGEDVRILGGVEPGEIVVTAGVSQLQPGQQVRLMDGAE